MEAGMEGRVWPSLEAESLLRIYLEISSWKPELFSQLPQEGILLYFASMVVTFC
jgi:hypothetical protein